MVLTEGSRVPVLFDYRKLKKKWFWLPLNYTNSRHLFLFLHYYVDKTESLSTCPIFPKLLFCRQFCRQSTSHLQVLQKIEEKNSFHWKWSVTRTLLLTTENRKNSFDWRWSVYYQLHLTTALIFSQPCQLHTVSNGWPILYYSRI